MTRARWVSAAALAGLLACPGRLDAAAQGGSGGTWILPPGSLREPVATGALLHGAPADISYYEAPLEATAMIAHFEKHHAGLRDLAVLPGMAVLSRREGACTRVATVAGLGMGRSAGTLSQVCWSRAELADAPDWLPEGAHGVFDFSERASGFSQQVWRYAQAMDDVRARMEQGLTRQGWKRAHDRLGGMNGQQWERGGQRLVLELHAAEQGCMLAVLIHAEQGVPAGGAVQEPVR
jgi:hypothetical protein